MSVEHGHGVARVFGGIHLVPVDPLPRVRLRVGTTSRGRASSVRDYTAFGAATRLLLPLHTAMSSSAGFVSASLLSRSPALGGATGLLRALRTCR